MNKDTIALFLGGLFVVVLVLGLWLGMSYNSLVGTEENVNNAWARVQSAYQRRADLIPNLVSTVQTYTDYEGEVLTEITQARASVGQAQTPGELESAGNELNSALSRLLVVVENYPTLQANEQFRDLMVSLEGTENRIKVERDLYNEAVRTLNVKVRRFPTNIAANMFGFEQKDYFEAEEGAQDAPNVDELFN